PYTTLFRSMPLAINRFVVENGTLRYIDPENNVDVQIEQIQIVAINLRNGYDSTNTFPAGLEANAKIYDGQLNLEVDANPLAMDPTFKMNAALEQVDRSEEHTSELQSRENLVC